MAARRTNKWLKSLALVLCGVISLTLTSCDTAELPDEYNYDDLSKYIKLGKYKGVEYEAANTEVSSSEVMNYINEQLAQNATVKQIDEGVVKSDSVAVIDYEGRLNGELVDGASAEGVTIDMSHNNYVPGFVDGIIGHKVGDSFDMNVTFPKDYSPELASKTVVFSVVIVSLQTTSTPEYTDEYVKNNTNYDSKQAYEKAIRSELKANKKAEAEETREMEVFEAILSDSKVIKYPEKELKARYDALLSSYRSLANDNDVEFEAYIRNEMNMSVEEFSKQVEDNAKKIVKQELVLRQIASLEDIEISKKGYNKYLNDLLDSAGHSKSSFKEERGQSIEEYAKANNLFSSYLYKSVMERVMDYSVSK